MAEIPTFTELDEFEKGFAAVFAEKLAPKKQALERRRRVWFLGVFLAVAVNVALAGLILFGTVAGLSPVWLLLPLATFLATFAAVTKTFPLYSEGLRKELAPTVFGFLGSTYDRTAAKEDVSAWFKASGLLSWTEQRVEDHLSGSYAGSTYDLVEVELKKDGSTVFSGLLVRLDGRVDEAGLTDKLKKAIGSLSGKLNRSGTTSVHFEDKLGLAIPYKKDLFEAGSIIHAVDLEREARTMLTQATLPQRMIKHLQR